MLLIIDNYDSFTYNLVHYAQELGANTHVIRNDDLSAAEALALSPKAVILSPGPKTPSEAGICLEFLRTAPENLPIFGVCLGLQSMGQAFGGDVIAAKEIMHGKVSPVTHDKTGIFADIPSPFNATRYHSLALDESTLPDCLIANAWTQDGEIMAIRHKTRPIHGVQFHPESIASEYGHDMIAAFMKIAGLDVHELSK
ncbi:MAG: aminodeoxychorismate/anthranilate synthase component II [Robiginitomaculum sp.]|nr:MAG: aminodeoxychorismate/anthranilate synthase component II [Robiginitomaculum sp.]